MNLRVGEVGEAADVVDVEVRRDDVADVVASETELLHLAGGGLVDVERRPQQVTRGADAGGIGAVLEAEAGVDEHQPVVGLDEQHVAHDGGARCVHGAAVEVMDLHAHDPIHGHLSGRPNGRLGEEVRARAARSSISTQSSAVRSYYPRGNRFRTPNAQHSSS